MAIDASVAGEVERACSVPCHQTLAGTLIVFALVALVHLPLVGLLCYGTQWQIRARRSDETVLWTTVPGMDLPDNEGAQGVSSTLAAVAPVAEKNTDIAEPSIRPRIKRGLGVYSRNPPGQRRQHVSRAATGHLDTGRQEAPNGREFTQRRQSNARIDGDATRSVAPGPFVAGEFANDLLAQPKRVTDSPTASTISQEYATKIRARVGPNIVVTERVGGNPTATVELRLRSDGSILSARFVQTSGAPSWDQAVSRALELSDPLPVDADGSAPVQLIISFRYELQG